MVSCFILSLVLLLVVLLNCTLFLHEVLSQQVFLIRFLMRQLSKLFVVFLGFGLVPQDIFCISLFINKFVRMLQIIGNEFRISTQLGCQAYHLMPMHSNFAKLNMTSMEEECNKLIIESLIKCHLGLKTLQCSVRSLILGLSFHAYQFSASRLTLKTCSVSFTNFPLNIDQH